MAEPIKSIRIVPSVGGVRDVIEVGGKDIASVCQGYTLRVHVGNVPELELDVLVVAEENEFTGEALIVVPDRTREALVHLGWTPPGGSHG